jgi:alpha-1,2-mannosyltransferase
MIDLDVYRRTGIDAAGRARTSTSPRACPWIYPPFAALFTVPLGVVPLAVAQVFWIVLTVVLLMAMLYRLGLSGWVLSPGDHRRRAGSPSPCVRRSASVSLGVLLVAAAVLDSMPGRRILPPRHHPGGHLDRPGDRGEADPGHGGGLPVLRRTPPPRPGRVLHLRRRHRPGRWRCPPVRCTTGGLLSGDSGINAGIMFKTNQSIMGAWARLFGELSKGGLVLSAVVAVIGIAAAVLVHRAGRVSLAICVAGPHQPAGLPDQLVASLRVDRSADGRPRARRRPAAQRPLVWPGVCGLGVGGSVQGAARR